MSPEFDRSYYRLPKLPPGAQIATYTVIKALGSGGVGNVYLAKHPLLQHHVAIKVHEEFPSDDVIRTAFRRSASYLCQLRHPHTVMFVNYGFERERAYLAMEWIDGPNLLATIDTFQTKEGFKLALQYFEQLLDAVHYSHNCLFLDLDDTQRRGIIHGDIKPENILVSRGSIKLTDFMVPDVQRFLARRQHFRFSGVPKGLTDIFGTPYYMAPEQLVHGEVSERTDVFSLGVTLFHLLTGRYPYKDPDYLWNKDLRGQFRSQRGMELPATHLNPYVPEWIDAFIEKATRLNESERYQSVAEMQRDFLQHAKPSAVSTVTLNVKEVIMGDQTRIEIKHLSGVSGQLYIGKFNNVINRLECAGHGQLVSAVNGIKDAVMQSADLSDTQKREIVEMLTQFGEESAHEKPNHVLLRSLRDGLMSTLKAVPDVAKAISAVVPFLKGI